MVLLCQIQQCQEESHTFWTVYVIETGRNNLTMIENRWETE